MTTRKLLRFGNAKLLKNFSWRGSAPRMAVDVVLINLSVVSAFLLWFAVYIVFIPSVDSRRLARTFRLFYLDNFLFLSLVFLVTFACYGFYNQARRYENRYKMVVVAQAVTVALSAYTFLEYFLFRADLIPRGVAVLIWGLIFLTIGGARLAKSWLTRRFQLVPVQPGRSKKVRKVLVIGGGGYIGSILVHRLLAANYRVRVLDSLLYGDDALRDLGHHPGYELVVGDFRNVEAVVRACQGMEAVVHLGAIVGDPACALEPRLTTEINFAATKMVMEICKGYGISRFLFASTCSVYGATEHLVDEKSPVNPVSLYAATKLDSERVILNTNGNDFHPTILRLATAFGSSYRQRFDLVVNLLTVKALTEQKITIYNGAQWRPFIHIHDIARAFILCLEAPLEKVSRQLFNVGSYQMNFTLREVGEIIRGQVPDVRIEHIENQDKRNYRVSFDKVHAVLGFTCEKSILDGVSEIKRAYEQNLIGDYREKRYSNQQYLSSAAEFADQNEPQPAPLSLEFVRKLSLQGE